MELNCSQPKLNSDSKPERESGGDSNVEDEEEEEDKVSLRSSGNSGEERRNDCTDGLDFCELLAKFESVVHSFITEFIELQIYDASRAEIPRHYNLKVKIRLMNHILKKFEPNVRKRLQEEVLGTMCQILCNRRKIHRNSVTNPSCSNYPEILCTFMEEKTKDFSNLISKVRDQYLGAIDRSSYRAEIANQQLVLDTKSTHDVKRPPSPRVIPDRHFQHVLDQVFKADCCGCGGQGSVYTMSKCTEFPPPNARLVLGLSTALNPTTKAYGEERQVTVPPMDLCGSPSFRSYGTALGGYGKMKINEVVALQTFEESMLNYTLNAKCVPVLWCGSNSRGQPMLYSTRCGTDLSPIPLPMPCGPCGPLVQLYPSLSRRCGKKPRPSKLVVRKGKKHKKLKKKRVKAQQKEEETLTTEDEGVGNGKEKKKKSKKGKGKKKGKSKTKSKKKGKSKTGLKEKGKSKKGLKKKGKSKSNLKKKGKGKSRSESPSDTDASKGGKSKSNLKKKKKGKSRSGSPSETDVSKEGRSKKKAKKGDKTQKGKKNRKGESSDKENQTGKPSSLTSATGTDEPRRRAKGVGTSDTKLGNDKKTKGTQANDNKRGKNKGALAVVSTDDDESQTRPHRTKSTRDASGQTGKGGKKGKQKSPKSRSPSQISVSRRPSRSKGKKNKSRSRSMVSILDGSGQRRPGKGGKNKSRAGSTESILEGGGRRRPAKGGRSAGNIGRPGTRSDDDHQGSKGSKYEGSDSDRGKSRHTLKRSGSKTGTTKGKGFGSDDSSDDEGKSKRGLRDGKGDKRGGRSPSELRWKKAVDPFGKRGRSRSATSRLGSPSSRRGFLPPISQSKNHLKESKSYNRGYQKSRTRLPAIGTKSRFGVGDLKSKPLNYSEVWGRRRTPSIKAFRASDLKKDHSWKTSKGPGYAKSVRELSVSKQGIVKPWGTGPSYRDGMKEQARRLTDHASRYDAAYGSSMRAADRRPSKYNAKFEPSNKAGSKFGPGYKPSSNLQPGGKPSIKFSPGYKPSSRFDPGRKPSKFYPERPHNDPRNEGMKEQVRRPLENPSKYEKSHNSSIKDQVRGPMDHGPRSGPNYNQGVMEQVRRPSDRPSKYQTAYKSSMKEQAAGHTDRNTRYGPSYNEGAKEQLRQAQERASKYETAYNSSMKEQSRRPMDHNPKYDPRYNQGAMEQLRRPSDQASKYNARESTTNSGWRPSSAKSLPLLKKSEDFRAPQERAFRPTLGMDDSFSSAMANTWWDRRGKPPFLEEDCELPIDLESPQENFFWVPLGRYSWEMRNIKVWKSQVIDQKESLGSKEYMGIFPEIKLQKPQVNMSDTDLSLLSRKLHSTHSSTTSCCKICNICLLDTCYCQCR